MKIECKKLGDLEGNAADTVSNIVSKDMNVVAVDATLKSKYAEIKSEKVIVNGPRWL